MRYRIALPAGKKLVSANDRLDWKLRASLVASIRDTAERVAREMRIPPLGRVRVRAFYYYPDNGKRDPGNLAPSVKAMVDGLVRSGAIPDDHDEFLTDDGIHRGYPDIPGGQMVLQVTPYEESSLTMAETLESLQLPYAVILI
jgi:hypothetical protein